MSRACFANFLFEILEKQPEPGCDKRGLKTHPLTTTKQMAGSE